MSATPKRNASPKTDWVYILASGPRGALYLGMTSDLDRGRSRIAALRRGFRERK